MPAMFIVNPWAGQGRAARVWARVHPRLAGLGEWDVAHTTVPGQATELARAAVARGYDRVVAVGGDGTVSEVANGLAHTGAALGVVPAGTGNDFARCVRIPLDPAAAARLALRGSHRSLDLGEIQAGAHSHYFLNVAGFGFDAAVARVVNAYPKYLGGALPYLLGILQTLWRYRPQPVRLVADGRVLERKVLLVAVANCPTYAGGMRIAPDAVPDDGCFHVCLVGDLPPLEVLRLLPKIFSGGHRYHLGCEFLRCRELHVTSTVTLHCQADGELAGSLPVTFRLHRGGIRCITASDASLDRPSPTP